MLDVIDGLAEAHRVGMIHRDVKPSNCFLTADDRVKVGDFGWSKSLASDAARHSRKPARSSAQSCSPHREQIRGEPLDYSSDVYSVAATLYFLLCGAAPFHHENAAAALARGNIGTAATDSRQAERRFRTARTHTDAWTRTRPLSALANARRPPRSPGRFTPGAAAPRPARERSSARTSLDVLLLRHLRSSCRKEVLESHLQLERVHFHGTSLELVRLAIAAVAYFRIGEGIFSATVGKAMLGLRVVALGQTGPPRLLRALRTCALFALSLACGFSTARSSPSRLVRGKGEEAVGGGFRTVHPQHRACALLVQMRKRWHFRGLHDFASGCQVTQKPLPARKLRLAIQQPTPLRHAASAPARRITGVRGRVRHSRATFGRFQRRTGLAGSGSRPGPYRACCGCGRGAALDYPGPGTTDAAEHDSAAARSRRDQGHSTGPRSPRAGLSARKRDLVPVSRCRGPTPDTCSNSWWKNSRARSRRHAPGTSGGSTTSGSNRTAACRCSTSPVRRVTGRTRLLQYCAAASLTIEGTPRATSGNVSAPLSATRCPC